MMSTVRVHHCFEQKWLDDDDNQKVGCCDERSCKKVKL